VPEESNQQGLTLTGEREMTKLVLLGVLILITNFVFGQSPSQSPLHRKTFTAKTTNRPRPAPSPPPMPKQNTEGVLARAARGGNPLQMLNPKAPAVYGTSEDNVYLDPETGKWKGIKLLTINF
jgi:hypothetical protein